MNIIISNQSEVPIYQQIVNSIRADIVSGVLREGDSLPSIRTLAKEATVSVITTKKAYEILEEQGYIQTQPGKGSFVSSQSRELAREHKLSGLEQHLLSAIDLSRELGMEKEALSQMLDTLYEEV